MGAGSPDLDRYIVIENTPGYLPEDDEPFVGTWDEACAAMDALLLNLVDEGWTIEQNIGVGFRLPCGQRQTWLMPPDAHEHSLPRVVEVLPIYPESSAASGAGR